MRVKCEQCGNWLKVEWDMKIKCEKCGHEMERERYELEFPEFELGYDHKHDIVIAIPAGFDDYSWHNDAMPHFYNKEVGLDLWIDYENESESEVADLSGCREWKRFNIYDCPDYDNYSEKTTWLFGTNDWKAMLDFIATYTMKERIRTAVHDADLAFWAEIAKQFPEAESGDLGPDVVFPLSRMQEEAVRQWVYNNVLSEEQRETLHGKL